MGERPLIHFSRDPARAKVTLASLNISFVMLGGLIIGDVVFAATEVLEYKIV